MIGLRILEHEEGGADQLLAEVQSGSFHKLQAVLVNDDAHSSLLKHSVIFILVIDNRKLVLEPGAAASLHMYSQIIPHAHDFPESLHTRLGELYVIFRWLLLVRGAAKATKPRRVKGRVFLRKSL